MSEEYKSFWKSDELESLTKVMYKQFGQFGNKKEFNDTDKVIAEKALTYIEENLDKALAKDKNPLHVSSSEQTTSRITSVLEVLNHDSNIAQRAFNLAQSLDEDDKLHVYREIVKYSPENIDVFHKICEYTFANKLHSRFEDSLVGTLVNRISNDKELALIALEYIKENILPTEGDSYNDNPRCMIATLAAQNTEFPGLVEHCIELSESFPNCYQDAMYNRLLVAGYKANNFEDRYAQRLNNEEFDFQKLRIDAYNLDIPFQAVAGIADKLDTRVLRDVTEQAQRIIDYEESEANKWHREPYLSETDYENINCLSSVVDKRIKEEAIAEAKAQENPPAVIFIEEFVGERYGDWAERVYIKDAKGEYLATDIVDDNYNYWGNEDSSARDQLGNLVTAQGIIYSWDKETSAYQVLEAKEDCQYRVLSGTAYWRDKQTAVLHHRGANEGSVLVSENPVTGKFEDVPYDNIERDHGNFVEGAKKSDDGSWKKVIYKRSDQDGKFYPEIEFPYGECISCFQNSKDEISMSFLSDNGETFEYEANKKYSTLKKQEKGKDDWKIIYCSDTIQLKTDMLRKQLDDKVGKTGDVKTGEVTEEHRETAKKQAEISKAIIKAGRNKEEKGL